MTVTAGDKQPLPELPPEVVERVLVELPARGEKAVASLRTAASLITQATSDDRGLRFAESAAYNVREALDAVVSGRSPVEGGLPAVHAAWSRYESELAQPGNDGAASLLALTDVLRRVAEKRDRNSLHTSQLLGYLRGKSGVDPLPGELDPVKEYGQLRKEASGSLHTVTALDASTLLYERTVAWFIRMFTPPDALVHAVRALATEPWHDPRQITRLGELVSNQHHLRLFLRQLVDPAWLIPLYEADIVTLPQPDVPWPVNGLVDGLGRTAPAGVAALLERMLADSKQQLRPEQRLGARFELLRLATRLGAVAHGVVAGVVTAHPENRAVRALGAGAVKRADAADPLVERVARAVLRGKPYDHDRYYYELMLERHEAGLNPGNVVSRVRMVAAKVRDVAQHPKVGWVALDIARLTTALGEDDRDYLVIVTHYLARLAARAQRLGVSSTQLLEWTKNIPGEIGERITCRILAQADDIPVHDKVDHITRRLASSTATGDDKDLIDATLAAEPDPASLTVWTEALGLPSPAPEEIDAPLPPDWTRAWRWSMVLPQHILIRWQEPIAQVTARHGAPSTTALDHRASESTELTSQSAHSAEELAALPVLEAAHVVARWRPDADSGWRLQSARELARTLQTVIEADPVRWAADPSVVVTALREPVHVLHYFRALSTKATEVTPQTRAIIAAAKLARTEQWTPTILGSNDFDFEPDWRHVETATVDLVAALANHDGPLTEDLDIAWTWALALLDRAATTTNGSFDGIDALNRAINTHSGRGLLAVLALAGWEYRHNTNSIRPQFTETLDDIIRIHGSTGMEYRALLAARRQFLETVARDWLDHHATTLFRDNELGSETFDLTLKYARATPWFFSNLRDDLYAAARRNNKRAIACLLVGALRREPGYEPDHTVTALRGNTAALATPC
jgi:hypothetical protein